MFQCEINVKIWEQYQIYYRMVRICVMDLCILLKFCSLVCYRSQVWGFGYVRPHLILGGQNPCSWLHLALPNEGHGPQMSYCCPSMSVEGFLCEDATWSRESWVVLGTSFGHYGGTCQAACLEIWVSGMIKQLASSQSWDGVYDTAGC